MKNIFSEIGYSISNQKNNEQDAVQDVLFIKNADGSARWIWNADNSKPLFLKFYNSSGVRATIFISAIKMVFVLKLQKVVFNKVKYYFKKEAASFFDCKKDWALSTGTTGPDNKAILYTNGSFFKIATTVNAQKLIQAEHQILSNVAFDFFEVPGSKQISENVIQLSDITSDGVRSKRIGIPHLKALTEMNVKGHQLIQIRNWKLYNNLKADFNLIEDARIPKNMMRKIHILLEEISEEDYINVSFSHGDFTSWNIFESDEKVSLYDWELSAFDRPKGFDYFHFIIQQGILVDRKPWRKIFIDIKEQCSGKSAGFLFHNDLMLLNRYLKYYLLINCMNYLKIYASQPEWHKHVEWFLQVWNDALNSFVMEEEISSEVLTTQIYYKTSNTQSFNSQQYPGQLTMNSDIDMLDF